MVQFTYPGGRFTARATTVKFLMEWAYDILPAQHGGGPAWLDNQRYDIVAKAAGKATDEQMKLMTRRLLAERFQLELRHETREMQVLTLFLGKSAPKLFPPKDGEERGLRVEPVTGDGEKTVSFHVAATRFSLTQLIQTFARQLDRVMVNETGLTGEFDFTLDLTPDDHRPTPLDPSLLIDAMQSQLGLVVKSAKSPVDFWVVESAKKVISGN